MAKASKAGDPVQQTKRGGHMLRNIGIVIIVLIVAGGAYFYYEYLSGGVLNLVQTLATNPSAARSLVFSKINSNPEFNLGYTGTISKNVTTPQGDPIVTIPIYVSYQKYMNDTRTVVSFSNSSGTGHGLGIIFITNGSTSYACINNGTGYKCIRATESAQQLEQNLTNLLGVSNLTVSSVSSAAPSFYDNIPCFQISGNGNMGDSGILGGYGVPATFTFSGCFSSNYYVPLILNATISAQGGSPVNVAMRVVNITQSATQAQVTALPGPVNSTV